MVFLKIGILMFIGCFISVILNLLSKAKKNKRRNAARDRRHKADMEWARKEAQRRNYQV